MAPLLHLRLSDGTARAVPFTARDGRSLAAACASAYGRVVDELLIACAARGQPPCSTLYCTRDGRLVRAHSARNARSTAPVLELQVRPLAHESLGWFAPCQPTGATGVRYVRVYVTADLLDRRAPDDWTEIWSWCEASRAHDHALTRFVRDASAHHRPGIAPPED